MFDSVMVMDKDESIKNNRLGLLKQIYDTKTDPTSQQELMNQFQALPSVQSRQLLEELINKASAYPDLLKHLKTKLEKGKIIEKYRNRIFSKEKKETKAYTALKKLAELEDYDTGDETIDTHSIQKLAKQLIVSRHIYIPEQIQLFVAFFESYISCTITSRT